MRVLEVSFDIAEDMLVLLIFLLRSFDFFEFLLDIGVFFCQILNLLLTALE